MHQAVVILQQGGVAIYPTDSTYALGACLGHKKAVEKIRFIRQLEKKHNFTLICKDLSELATYAQVDNPSYRLIRAHTPGPYTFILKATAQVPRLLLHPRRRSIGLRIPDCKVLQDLLGILGQPMLSSTLMLPGDEQAINDPTEIIDRLGEQVNCIIDSGCCGIEPTTVVSLLGDVPEVIREGKADASMFIV